MVSLQFVTFQMIEWVIILITLNFNVIKNEYFNFSKTMRHGKNDNAFAFYFLVSRCRIKSLIHLKVCLTASECLIKIVFTLN